MNYIEFVYGIIIQDKEWQDINLPIILNDELICYETIAGWKDPGL